MPVLENITISGFKSIQSLREFPLHPLNVLIGANGAGKSNFVGFFQFLRDLIEQKLQLFVQTQGSADALLYLGPKVTRELNAQLRFGENGYDFTLVPTSDNRLVFSRELAVYRGRGLQYVDQVPYSLGSGHVEANLKDRKDDLGATASKGVENHVFNAISSWVVYHFHDTGSFASVRRERPINDNAYLRPDGENLAAFLYRIERTHPKSYSKIRDAVRLAAPFFDDFNLRPIPTKPEFIQLEWSQLNSDYPFRASQLSDGTLRFICLATALLQPDPPKTMLFDEPELGLHPYALSLLGNLMQNAVAPHGFATNQLIVSTQSALLLNEFVPEDVVVVERIDSQSVFRRLNSSQLSEWLSDYNLGELWQKNLLGGRPTVEHPNGAEVSGELRS